MYLHGYPFLFDRTLKTYLTTLELFSIRISEFNTTWLLKCFVVDLLNLGEIWGEAFQSCPSALCSFSPNSLQIY